MANKSLRAISEFVLVKVLPQEQKAGSILLPEGYKSNESIGLVVSCGAGVDEELEPGDTVVFETHYGHNVNATGEKLIVLKAKDIWGVLTDAD